MAKQSPFSRAAEAVAGFQPPAWMVDESLHRLVLFLNHVLQGEPEAMRRLARHKGRSVLLVWQRFELHLQATPAGLLELGRFEAPDLRLTVAEDSPLDLLSILGRGDKPKVHIEGDVQLAAEVNWLTDNVRWDIEEDLARLLGDAPAHALAGMARQAVAALRSLVARRSTAAAGGPT